MKYLFGEIVFHFDNFKAPAPTRFVYSSENKIIILAEVFAEGKYYELKDDYLAELEAGVLSFENVDPSIQCSDQLPQWARTRFIQVTVLKNGEGKIFNLSDVERTVDNLLELPLHDRGPGFGPEDVKGLIEVIKTLIGAN